MIRRAPLLTMISAWAAAMACATAVSGQVVERRGGLPPVSGEILLVDDGGVTVQVAAGQRQLIPWDQIRTVNSPSHEATIRSFGETAEMIWRARSRLERRDTALAEPLFERLFEQSRGRSDQTALVIAEGLLRCRLARGAHALAVIPALETIRLRRAGFTHESTGTYAQLPSVIDQRHELCTVLAPWWISSPVLPNVHQDVTAYDAQGDEVVAAMAGLYALSIGRALGVQAVSDAALPGHLGVELLEYLIGCTDPDATARERARNWLAKAEATLPAFAQAWARFFSGLSLLMETGLVRQQRGLVNLLHLPALHSQSQKYLAGAALELAAASLEAQGDAEAAAGLRTELSTAYPNHPVLQEGRGAIAPSPPAG